MSKHTPGPWRLEVVEDGGIRHLCPVAASDDGDVSLLTVVVAPSYDDEYTAFAAVYHDEDARLIAAAPDLLEALVDIELVLRCNKLAAVENSTIHYAVCKARAAIAKVEGRV